jgi:hypothetical protein
MRQKINYKRELGRRLDTSQNGSATRKNAPRTLPMAAGRIPQARALPQPGPIPSGWMSEKYAMLAGLCKKPPATNTMTISNTGIYLPMIVRPIAARNAAIPTSQLPSMPETTALKNPSTPPMF